MKILVVRFSSIGDIVLTTPVVRCIKNQLPSSEIHYLTKKSFLSVIEANPYIDKIYTINRSIKEIIPILKNENYDFIVDLHNNIRTKSLTFQLKKPFTRFPKLHLLKWIYVQFKIDRLPALHIVDRYFKAVEKLGVSNDQKPCDFFLLPEDKIDPFAHFGLKEKSYIAFAIGAQFATKRLPIHKIIEICEGIDDPIILLGGKDDIDISAKIKQKLPNKIINACGLLRIGQSASVVQNAKAVITHDTGLMHIASAFQVPIISIWGNTTPSLGMSPYNPQQTTKVSIHQVAQLSCRPCSKIGFQSCPKKHFHCMELQNVNEIIAQTNSFIGQNPS
jgi:ADP-heptose:LPS heptosyltransferase